MSHCEKLILSSTMSDGLPTKGFNGMKSSGGKMFKHRREMSSELRIEASVFAEDVEKTKT